MFSVLHKWQRDEESGHRLAHSHFLSLSVCAGLSAMIRGADDGELFVVRDYSEDELENVLEEFFSNPKRTWRTENYLETEK